MTQSKDQLFIPAIADLPQPISAALWRMIDSRERTIAAVNGITHTELDWQAEGLQNSIGTLLYHIAAVEMDWLYSEILVRDWDAPIETLFSLPMRDATGRLSVVRGESLAEQLTRLETTRRTFIERVKVLALDDFYRLRDLPSYAVSPEWVLHHLAQHEDEHRGEITTIKTLYAFKQASTAEHTAD